MSRIGQLAHSWFPKAFAHGVKPLPSASAFQHHFLRLCNLADWIGSDEMWFQYVDEPHDDYIATARERASSAISAIGLDTTAQRESVSEAGVPKLTEPFPKIATANAIQ